MKRVSSYLKMRVLGAIESAPGETCIARIHHVSEQVFLDEDGQRFRFTWRTILTWHSRYKKDGITTMLPKPRSDKGKTRKVMPEEVLEAIEQVRGSFRGPHNIQAFYRACVEKGLLQRDRIAGSNSTARRIASRCLARMLPGSSVQPYPTAFPKAKPSTVQARDRPGSAAMAASSNSIPRNVPSRSSRASCS